MFYHNVVVGKPLVPPHELIARDAADWIDNECDRTLFTEERWMPAILKAAGVVASTSEVKRNRPELLQTLNELDCLWVRWGKKKIYIIVGE